MKAYLARLAVRAAPVVHSAPAPVTSVADPFAETEGPATSAEITDAAARRITANTAPQSFAKSEETSHTSIPTMKVDRAEGLPSSAETPARPFSVPEILPATDALSEIPERALKLESAKKTDESSPQPTVLTGRESLQSVLPPAGDEAEKRGDQESEKVEPLLPPTHEDELLRLADAFMSGLKEKPSHEPVAEPESQEPPTPLSPREPVWRDSQMAPTHPQSEAVPSVHIGSLRVEVVQPSAAPAGGMPFPQRVIRRSGSRMLGRGGILRQHFGLRQL